MIDSHCHLAADAFSADLEAVLARARRAGVERMVTIGDTLEESQKCLDLAEKYDHIFCTVGVHPHHASTWNVQALEALAALAQSSPSVRAIGEIGLDYHYDFSPREDQKEAFMSQWSLAKRLRLPAVVHCREAVEDVWAIVREDDEPRVVIHCCTEKWEDVERFVDAGHFLSFTGIATYPHAEEIRKTIRACPLSRLMIETDSPFLAPVPHRGKRNEPAYVAEVLQLVAREKGIAVEEAEKATTANVMEFFALPA